MTTIRELITKFGFDVDDRPLEQMDASIERAKGSLIAMTAVVGAVSAGVGFLLNKAGQDEQTQIAFETMLGSAEKAKKMMEDIKKFADSTPFTTDEVVQASKGLLAFGIEEDKIIEKTEKLGNIAAGVGRDKFGTLIRGFGKIKTKGKASMEELNMFLEAGVPILDELAKNLGKSKEEIFKVVSAGKVGFKEVDEALTTLSTGSGKFAGLMAKQSKSFLGLVSTIQGQLDNYAKEIGSELLPVAKEYAQVLLKWFAANKMILKQKIVGFLKSAVKFLTEFVAVVKTLLSALDGIVSVFGGWETVIRGVLTAMLLLFGLNMLNAIGSMALGIVAIIKGMKTLRMATLLTNAAMASIPILIGLAIVAIGLLFEDLVAYVQGKDSVVGRIEGAFESMFTSLNEMWQHFGVVGRVVLTTLLTPVRILINAVRGLGGIFGALSVGDVKGAVGAVKESLGNIILPDSSNIASAIGFSGENVKKQEANVSAPITINVPADTPPEKVADAARQGIDDSLGKLFQDTERQLRSPVYE